MTAAQPSKWECPQCKQIDQVQRVSAIVKTGTMTGTLTGTTTGGSDAISHLLTRDDQTLLSKLLASPKKPSAWWLQWRPALSRGVVVILLIIGVSALIVQMIMKYTGALRASQDAASTQYILIGIGLIALLISAFLNNSTRRYNKLRKKWKQTYYCHRCDRFFVPIEPPPKPGMFRKLLVRLRVQKPQKLEKPQPIAPEDMQIWLRARKWKSK